MRTKTKLTIIIITAPIWIPVAMVYFWVKDLYDHCKR